MLGRNRFQNVVLYALMPALYYLSSTNAIRSSNGRNNDKVQPRLLVFPPTAPTRLQFIGGIGIPVEDLNFESITSGYVLKAEYFLPETALDFRQKIKPQNVNRRSFNESYSNNGLDDSNETIFNLPYRWILYRTIEMILDKKSLNGRACLLRSICEHSSVPLTHESGLFAEVLHIILTPSASNEHTQRSNKYYLQAEINGRSGRNCEEIYKKCINSPMDMISAVIFH